MNETTNIADLQMDPIGTQGTGNNIAMKASEQYNPTIEQQRPAISQESLDDSTVNLLINGLQKAVMSGSTKLPSRDIPMMPNTYTNDAQIQQNYIPPPRKNNYDYIQETEDNESIINNYKKKDKKSEYTDEVYNEIQMPLLIVVLYFLFQLPFAKKWLFHYLPYLFLKDGNYNIYGFGFTSFLFGFIYYIINKITIQLGNI
jgi:hypothetical protein